MRSGQNSSFNPRPQSNLTATHISQLNQQWILDIGAAHHLTHELENLSLNIEYHGSDTVKIGDGKSLPILHTGSSLCHSQNHSFLLNDILHVPDACSNLLYVQAFTAANNVSIKFFPNHFIVKDVPTRQLFLTGPTDGVLYSMLLDPVKQASSHASSPTALLALSLNQWHSVLGHANIQTVHKVLHQSNISFQNQESFIFHA